jgi:hypothetical protein
MTDTFWKDADDFVGQMEVLFPGRGEEFRRLYNRALVTIDDTLEKLKKAEEEQK